MTSHYVKMLCSDKQIQTYKWGPFYLNANTEQSHFLWKIKYTFFTSLCYTAFPSYGIHVSFGLNGYIISGHFRVNSTWKLEILTELAHPLSSVRAESWNELADSTSEPLTFDDNLVLEIGFLTIPTFIGTSCFWGIAIDIVNLCSDWPANSANQS